MGSIPISSTNSGNNLARRRIGDTADLSISCLFWAERAGTLPDFLELRLRSGPLVRRALPATRRARATIGRHQHGGSPVRKPRASSVGRDIRAVRAALASIARAVHRLAPIGSPITSTACSRRFGALVALPPIWRVGISSRRSTAAFLPHRALRWSPNSAGNAKAASRRSPSASNSSTDPQCLDLR